ncbi:MAG TPA: HEAT repeat domain-containing protein [Patescibacteria group bacterium]|nr:HEAT repeat domain-containing protein [Patescibacteria group bacterium]
MPWEAIKYVGSGLTLAAFIVAAIAWLLKSKSEERGQLIHLAKEEDRADLVRDALEFFRIDTSGLTKAQQYQLALEQIRARAQRFKTVAVIVCVVDLLGAVIAVYALNRPSNGGVESDKKKARALLGDAQAQFKARAYSGAWKTTEQAMSLDPGFREAQELQVDTAMAQLREWRSAPQEVFDLIDNKLAPCLAEAAPKAKGVRAAEIHAHIGWANLLRRIDNLPVEEEFQKAVGMDSTNPYAHAMWGYWLIVRAHKPEEGKTQFELALKSGKQPEFVQQLQLDAARSDRGSQSRLGLIRVVDQMRRNKEKPTVESRRRLFSDIYVYPEPEFLRGFKTILPAADHLATFEWLTEGFDDRENAFQAFFLAELTEAAGNNSEALRLYRELLALDIASSSLVAEINEGIKRTRGSTGQGVSETSALIQQAKSSDVASRAKLIRSLVRADIDAAEALPAVVSWVQDPDGGVRAAAYDTLVQFGKMAVPKVIPLLSSSERGDVMNAAGILGKIGLEPKLAVPALSKALEHPDAEVRGKVVEALANFGPDAEPAVAVILQILTKTVQTDPQKQIAYTLGEIGPAAKDAVPQLIELLKSNKDREGLLNVVAADALGRIGPAASNAVPALIAALKSDDVRLPTRAEEALGSIGAGAGAAIPALIDALKFTEKQHWDNCLEPVGKIAEALANRGDTSFLPLLKKAMTSLEAANAEPKYITPVRQAIDVLKEKAARGDGK